MDKKSLFNLIESIKEKTGLSEKGISLRLGYKSGHVAQVKNRGPISDKFVNALKREFDMEDEKKYTYDPAPPQNIVSEPAVVYGNASDPNYLIAIIKLQAEAILSQQTTIYNLTHPASKKTA